jgi:hypothetical protein
MLNNGGEGGSLDSYYLRDWRERNKPVDAPPSSELPRQILEATRAWFETDLPAERGKPLDAFNHPELFRAGTDWLKAAKKADPERVAEVAAMHGALVGETKGHSLDTEARARGESMDAEVQRGWGFDPYSDHATADAAAVSDEMPRVMFTLRGRYVYSALADWDSEDETERRVWREGGPSFVPFERPKHHVEDVVLIDLGVPFDQGAAREALRRGISERAFAKEFSISLRQSRQFREVMADLLDWDLHTTKRITPR